MKTWLKLFLLTLAAILGASALWVWAAPLTGNIGKTVQFTETNGFDIGGFIRSNTLALHQLGSPPAASGALNDWYLYALSTGVFSRDPAGNIRDLFGGTTSSGVGLTARLITTTNITRSGEQTFEGILTSSSRVFVAGQTTPTENGIFITAAGAWTRATDAAAGSTFATGTLVTISDGIAGPTGNKGTTWMYITAGTYNTSALTAIRTGLGPIGELLSSKNAGSGYAGLTAATKQIWTQRGDAVTLAAIGVTGQLTPTASTIRVSGSGAPVTMTSGNPRILGCTTSADDGKELTVEGSDATNTLTMPTGNGVKLCGDTGSITFGLNRGSAHFVCNGATPVWRQSNCPTLQTVANVGKDIDGATSTGTAVRIGDITAGNYLRLYGNTMEGICSGAACATTTLTNPQFAVSGSQPTCAVGVRFLRWDTAGGGGTADTHEVCDKDSSDVYAWRTSTARGTVTTTIPLQRMAVNVTDANAFMDTIDGTNFDYTGIRYVDAVTGIAFWKGRIPPNLAATPAWALIITAKAISGSGGNIVASISAKDFTTNVAFDSALTALQTSTTYAINTSANTTTFTTTGTNYDGVEALAANNLLVVSISRVGGSGSDTINADLLVMDVALRIDVQ